MYKYKSAICGREKKKPSRLSPFPLQPPKPVGSLLGHLSFSHSCCQINWILLDYPFGCASLFHLPRSLPHAITQCNPNHVFQLQFKTQAILQNFFPNIVTTTTGCTAWHSPTLLASGHWSGKPSRPEFPAAIFSSGWQLLIVIVVDCLIVLLVVCELSSNLETHAPVVLFSIGHLFSFFPSWARSPSLSFPPPPHNTAKLPFLNFLSISVCTNLNYWFLLTTKFPWTIEKCKIKRPACIRAGSIRSPVRNKNRGEQIERNCFNIKGAKMGIHG